MDGDTLARVNNEFLYASDLDALTKGLKEQDSTEALKQYAQTWVRKKLLLQKAAENIDNDDVAIIKKVEEYREALILYEYEKALIFQKLDTTVPAAHLQSEYEKVRTNFPLEDDVFLIFFIKIKKEAPDLDKARKWIMQPKGEDDLQRLEGYVKEFAVNAATQKGIWYTRENLIRLFSLNENDISSLSNSGKFKEFKTDEGVWFIRIAEKLKKDEPAPLQFVSDKIIKNIIEKRRIQLIEKVYDKIEQEGIKSKDFEIYIK